MVQVLATITVASGCNVKVTLHPVQVQAAIHAAAIRPALWRRRLCPLGLLSTKSHNVVHMLLAKALIVGAVPAFASVQLAILTLAESVHALCVNPLVPCRSIALQLVPSKNAITRCVLDVDVEVVAVHLDNDVEVDLHVVPDTLFDGKRVMLGSAPPLAYLGPQEDAGDEEHGDGPFAAA